ncbi:unnamed protein product [Vitrella brassicaformis CCMP3155]|uniref:BRCA2 OB1 domain-containing protein n=1 Tax=Vitrella brassicaformis (strain CCMP3155) TaxID=1169540 RepID=A0A0G4EV02_VITBC|nr:unnamed protein product [Vitrella brassicaformis CCMP3155]|eukprot:CEM01867.1 unnamed protein product [Vitrella brassicaformis CCMP3155]
MDEGGDGAHIDFFALPSDDGIAAWQEICQDPQLQAYIQDSFLSPPAPPAESREEPAPSRSPVVRTSPASAALPRPGSSPSPPHASPAPPSQPSSRQIRKRKSAVANRSPSVPSRRSGGRPLKLSPRKEQPLGSNQQDEQTRSDRVKSTVAGLYQRGLRGGRPNIVGKRPRGARSSFYNMKKAKRKQHDDAVGEGEGDGADGGDQGGPSKAAKKRRSKEGDDGAEGGGVSRDVSVKGFYVGGVGVGERMDDGAAQEEVEAFLVGEDSRRQGEERPGEGAARKLPKSFSFLTASGKCIPCVDNPALQKIRAAVGAPSTRLLAPDEVIEGAAKAGLLQNVTSTRHSRPLKQDDPEPPADQMDGQDDDNMDDMPPPPPPAFVAAPFPRPMGFTTGKGNQLNIQMSAKNRDRLAHLFDNIDNPAAAAGPAAPRPPNAGGASMGGFRSGMDKPPAINALEDHDRSNGRMGMGSDSRPSKQDNQRQMDEHDDDMDAVAPPPPPPPAFVAPSFPRPMGFTTGKGNQLNIQMSAKNRDRLAHLFDGIDDPAAATSAASAAAGPPPPPLPSGAAASMGEFSTGMGKRRAAMLEDDDYSNGRMSIEMGSDSRPSRPPPLPPPLPAPLPSPPAVGRPAVLGGFTKGGGFKPVAVSDAAMAKVKAIFDDDDDDDNKGNGSSPLPLPAPAPAPAPALPKQAPPQPLSAPRAFRPPQIRPLGVRPLHRPPMMRGRGGRGTKPFRPPFARGGLHSRVATAPPGAGAGRGVGVSRLTDKTDKTEGEGEGDGNGDVEGEGVEEDMQMEPVAALSEGEVRSAPGAECVRLTTAETCVVKDGEGGEWMGWKQVFTLFRKGLRDALGVDGLDRKTAAEACEPFDTKWFHNHWRLTVFYACRRWRQKLRRLVTANSSVSLSSLLERHPPPTHRLRRLLEWLHARAKKEREGYRSPIKQIAEGDEPAGIPLVLDLHLHYGEGQMLPTVYATDGWYLLKGSLADQHTQEIVKSIYHVFRVAVSGACLENRGPPCPPLDLPAECALKIHYHAMHPIPQSTPLGRRKATGPMIQSVEEIMAGGGKVELVDVVVLAVFPLAHREYLRGRASEGNAEVAAKPVFILRTDSEQTEKENQWEKECERVREEVGDECLEEMEAAVQEEDRREQNGSDSDEEGNEDSGGGDDEEEEEEMDEQAKKEAKEKAKEEAKEEARIRRLEKKSHDLQEKMRKRIESMTHQHANEVASQVSFIAIDTRIALQWTAAGGGGLRDKCIDRQDELAKLCDNMTLITISNLDGEEPHQGIKTGHRLRLSCLRPIQHYFAPPSAASAGGSRLKTRPPIRLYGKMHGKNRTRFNVAGEHRPGKGSLLDPFVAPQLSVNPSSLPALRFAPLLSLTHILTVTGRGSGGDDTDNSDDTSSVVDLEHWGRHWEGELRAPAAPDELGLVKGHWYDLIGIPVCVSQVQKQESRFGRQEGDGSSAFEWTVKIGLLCSSGALCELTVKATEEPTRAKEQLERLVRPIVTHAPTIPTSPSPQHTQSPPHTSVLSHRPAAASASDEASSSQLPWDVTRHLPVCSDEDGGWDWWLMARNVEWQWHERSQHIWHFRSDATKLVLSSTPSSCSHPLLSPPLPAFPPPDTRIPLTDVQPAIERAAHKMGERLGALSNPSSPPFVRSDPPLFRRRAGGLAREGNNHNTAIPQAAFQQMGQRNVEGEGGRDDRGDDGGVAPMDTSE